MGQEIIGPLNQNKKTRKPIGDRNVRRSSSSSSIAADKETVAEISMERPPPPPPPQPPKETLVRGFKFAWRALLISNLALGAYIFTRPRKKESVKKNKNPKTIPDHEEALHEPEKIPIPVPDNNQWSKPFKW